MMPKTMLRARFFAVGLLTPLLVQAVACLVETRQVNAADTSRPNVVYILADDLGIGDVGAFNEQCKIKTPSMDQLAAEGMRFTDAHSGSAVCTPTRYGVLTGRYAWRTRLQSGVLWGYSLPLIAPDRVTVASFLKNQGYSTACVGKWHLGLQWGLHDESQPPNDSASEPWDNIDFSKPIVSGPKQVGFDKFYGISASLDMHPHVYISDDRVTSVPTRIIDGSKGMKYWRKGPVGDDFRHVDVLDHLTDQAVDFISQQDDSKPFFLYFPLPAPHKPIIPSKDFQNQSGLNPWGDFVMQVDSVVGRVMAALEGAGVSKNTLFILTSDNGATPGADFPALAAKGHDPSGIYRGNKADIYEGGHRVAFIARWPAVVAAGSQSDAVICHTDLLATVADIADVDLPPNAGEDSFSLLPLLKQEAAATTRDAVIHHSINGTFAIRQSRWKLALCPGSAGWSDPRPPKARQMDLPPVQLFDFDDDVTEQKNVADEHPEVVDALRQQLRQYIVNGRSTPGPSMQNDVKVNMTK